MGILILCYTKDSSLAQYKTMVSLVHWQCSYHSLALSCWGICFHYLQCISNGAFKVWPWAIGLHIFVRLYYCLFISSWDRVMEIPQSSPWSLRCLFFSKPLYTKTQQHYKPPETHMIDHKNGCFYSGIFFHTFRWLRKCLLCCCWRFIYIQQWGYSIMKHQAMHCQALLTGYMSTLPFNSLWPSDAIWRLRWLR